MKRARVRPVRREEPSASWLEDEEPRDGSLEGEELTKGGLVRR